MTMFIHIVDCKQSYFLRTRTTPVVFERKVWSGCRNGKDGWGKELARFTREDCDYGASHLPNREEKATVLQSIYIGKIMLQGFSWLDCIKFAKSGNSLSLSPRKFLFTHSWLRIWTTATLFSLASRPKYQTECPQKVLTFRHPYLIFIGFLWLFPFI